MVRAQAERVQRRGRTGNTGVGEMKISVSEPKQPDGDGGGDRYVRKAGSALF